jgi:hypothetical protein
MKTILKRTAIAAALGSAVLLAGCATGPYYDGGYYGYNNGYYGDAPYYYEPGYVGPSVGLGLGYSTYDRDYRHQWRDHGDWRDGRRDDNARERERQSVGRPGDRNNDGIRDTWRERQSAGQQDRGGRPEPVEQHDQRG